MHYVSNEELETIDRSIPKIVILSGKNDKLVPPDSSANRETQRTAMPCRGLTVGLFSP